jgi:hypothetical protein
LAPDVLRRRAAMFAAEGIIPAIEGLLFPPRRAAGSAALPEYR